MIYTTFSRENALYIYASLIRRFIEFDYPEDLNTPVSGVIRVDNSLRDDGLEIIFEGDVIVTDKSGTICEVIN